MGTAMEKAENFSSDTQFEYRLRKNMIFYHTVNYSAGRYIVITSYETNPSNVYGTSAPAVKRTKLPIKVQKAGFRKLRRWSATCGRRKRKCTCFVHAYLQCFCKKHTSEANAILPKFASYSKLTKLC